MVVLVEDVAETITSLDGEAFPLAWFGDRLGEWALWSCVVRGAVYTDPGLGNHDVAVGRHGIERCGVSAVAVSDEVFHGGVGVLQVRDQVPGRLDGPGWGGVWGCAEDADAPGAG
jgi:hypothetical protein